MPDHPQDFGPYRVVRQLAAGGMAEIYLARQRGLEGIERTVVVKRIRERYAHDAEFVTMFLDEARLMAALSHPNIAQVFDVGKVEGSTYYLVMEHVRGPTLGALLKAARAAGHAGLPRREALGIGLAIAEALLYVHDRRDELGRPLDIVHRDLNPANVIVSYEGGVKLIDFGIAKAATKVYETRTGVIKGTYGYIAPEQLVGAQVDRRADVFALGILLYEMCVGEHPFDASDEPDLVNRILEARYRRPRQVRPEIPIDLDRLIVRCLAPHPEGRPETVAAVIEALAAHLGEQRLVPTQHAIAALARELLPDDEGPRPLKRPSAARTGRRPFAEEPTTHKVQPVPKRDEPDAWIVLERSDGAPARPTPPPIPRTSRPNDQRTSVVAAAEEPLMRRMEPREPPHPTPLTERIPPTRRMEPREPPHPTPLTERLPPIERRMWAPHPSVRPARWIAPALGFGGLVSAGLVALVGARALGGESRVPVTQTMAAPAPSERPHAQELRIVSDPPGARVLVDGRPAEGVTPLVMPVPTGTQRVSLRLSKPGYVEQEREVSAADGEARFVLTPTER